MTVPPSSESPHGVPDQNTGTGAPFALDDPLTAAALDVLEFDAALTLVAGFAAGPLGAARVRGRRPTDDAVGARLELSRVAEAAALLRSGEGLAAEPVPDVARTLARLRIGGAVLEGSDLAALRRMLAAARRVRASLLRHREAAPGAAALLAELPPAALDRLLERAVEDDGVLRDGARRALGAGRRAVHAARERLVRRLEAMLRALGEGAPPDAGVTVREGRYVIPVRRDHRGRPGGSVHDESASQGTLFIEPTEAVEQGNALREAELREGQETLRVLRALSEAARAELAALRAGFEMCVAADDLVARARYAVAVDGERPELGPAPSSLSVRRGRHPLLIPAGGVVPFDLDLVVSERTLLLNGPNTGGKTVLLKAVGLCCALAQARSEEHTSE